MSTKSQSTSRVRKRKLARAWKWSKWASLPILILGLSLGLKIGWESAKRWSFLKITKIEISGNRHTSREEILVLSGIKPGMGIFDFKLGEAVRAIEFHPWVKEARVSRQLPDQVLITVKEKEPMAILVMGEVFYLNSEWKVFKKLILEDDLQYPIFTGLTLEDLNDQNSQALAQAKGGLLIWQLAGSSKLFPRDRISEFHISPATGLNLITRRAQRIIFGEDNFEEKFRTLELICVELREEFYRFRDLDLSRPDRVVARLLKNGKTIEPEAEAQEAQ